MALCSDPTHQSAQKVLDGADIVRDGDLSTTIARDKRGSCRESVFVTAHCKQL